MARLFGVITNEKGTEKHQIGNKELDIALYYGSRDRSVRAINILLTYDKSKSAYDLYIDGKLYKSFK